MKTLFTTHPHYSGFVKATISSVLLILFSSFSPTTEVRAHHTRTVDSNIAGASGAAVDYTATVNCDTGGSIQTELDFGHSVEFSGTCIENVRIDNDGLFVDGKGTGSGGTGGGIIQGRVTVQGADFVRLEGFKLQNPSGGDGRVLLFEGAHVLIKNVTFDNLNSGFCIARHSFADIVGLVSTTQTSPGSNECTNISVYDGSAARIWNTTINNDIDVDGNGPPVYALRDSHMIMRGGNNFDNDGTEAVLGVFENSHIRDDDVVTGTINAIDGAAIGFLIDHSSSYEMRQSTVTAPDNYVKFGSTLRVGSSELYGGNPANIVVSGDVTASHNSTMHINSAANMNGTVSCESFSTLNNVSLSGTGSVNCPYEIKTQGFSILNHDEFQDLMLDDAGNIYLAGTFNPASSREVKTRFEAVDTVTILDRVMELPITEWSYKRDEQSTRHIGPMSEDFYMAFGLGKGNKSISTTDSSGIALAAIQGLKETQDRALAEKDVEIRELKEKIFHLHELITHIASENLLLIPNP